MSEVTLFWTLYVNGDFEAFADLIDDECEYVMMPTMEVSRGKSVILKAMGRVAGAFDRVRRLPTVTFDAATSEFGVFEFVTEGTIASGIADFAAHSDRQFTAEPSTLVRRSYSDPVCIVYQMPNGRLTGSMSTQMLRV